MGKIIGVDFGTAYYRLAVIEGNFPTPIYDKTGLTVFPAVVACTKGKQWLVGNHALQQARENRDSTFYSIKNLLGSGRTLEIHGVEFTPLEIISHFFEKIKEDAHYCLDQRCDEVVISYPATFSMNMVDELRKAAELAYLHVSRMINQTDAIACLYLNQQQIENEYITIVDIGAGSCSIGTYQLGDGVIETKALDGSNEISGNNINHLLLDYCIKEFDRMNGFSCKLDHHSYMKLYNMTELAKILLSDVELYRLFIPSFIKDIAGKAYDIDIILTRNLLDNLIYCDIICILELMVLNNLKNACLQIEDISKIIVSGSVTNMPVVKKKLSQLMHVRKLFSLSPNAVALGAAIQGGILTGEVKDILLMTCTTNGYGILTHGGEIVMFLENNTTIPSKKIESFKILKDKIKTQIEVHVIETSGNPRQENKLIGTLVMPYNQIFEDEEVICVTIDIDANNRIIISATIVGDSKNYYLTVPVPYVLPSIENVKSYLV